MCLLLCIVLSFLCNFCRTEVAHPSNMTTTIGTDVTFWCQYDIPDKNYESVYWYLQRADRRLKYIHHVFQGTVELKHYQLSVDRKLSSSNLTIKNVQPRDKATYYCAPRAP